MKNGFWKKALCVMSAAVMACTLAVGCNGAGGGKNYAENNTEYYLGVSGPLSGGAAAYGTAVYEGAKLAVDEINAAGGVNGVKINFKMLDDQHNKDKVANNYTSMYENGMQFSLGCVTSKPCLEFKEYSHEDNLFFMTPSATADDVLEYDNAYQMCFSDSSQGTAAAQYVKALTPQPKLGVLYKSDDPYSAGIFEMFKKQFTATEFSQITVCSFVDGTTDFTSFANTLKDCEFIFMPFYYDEASTFMTNAKGIIAGDAVYFGCDGFDGIDAMDGFDINTIPQEVSYLSHFNSSATEGNAGTFIANYKKAYNGKTPIQFAASAYDCVYALAAAIEFAQSKGKDVPANLSASEFCILFKDVFQNSEFSFTGVTGTNIAWQKNGSVNTTTKVVTRYLVKAADDK